MNQNRSKVRAVAIAKTEETKANLAIKAYLIAICALTALAALPALWSL